MFTCQAKKMPSLGISGRAFVLVYYWHPMPGRWVEELGAKNKNVPEMYGFQVNFILERFFCKSILKEQKGKEP
jgi:hypothetical protein